jgi:hypothetical protein
MYTITNGKWHTGRRLYHGVLYLKISHSFTVHVNAKSIHAHEKRKVFHVLILRNSKLSTALCADICQMSSEMDNKCEKHEQKSFYSPKLSSLQQFSQKSQLHNTFLWTFLVLNFIQIKQKM